MMMSLLSLLSLLRSIFNTEKNIDVRILPSQGLFYNDDFSLKIKKLRLLLKKI
jgi:hypothetical protein